MQSANVAVRRRHLGESVAIRVWTFSRQTLVIIKGTGRLACGSRSVLMRRRSLLRRGSSGCTGIYSVYQRLRKERDREEYLCKSSKKFRHMKKRLAGGNDKGIETLASM